MQGVEPIRTACKVWSLRSERPLCVLSFVIFNEMTSYNLFLTEVPPEDMRGQSPRGRTDKRLGRSRA